MTTLRLTIVPLAVLSLLSAKHCSSAPERTERVTRPPTLAITNVNVIPMDRERVIEDQTVVITDGRISAIGPARDMAVANTTTTIDGRGKYLMPGLIDMHVHIEAEDLAEYVKYGVTTVRNMWGFDALPPIIRDVDSGKQVGPRIFSLTAGFDGSPPRWPQTQISDDVTKIPAMLDKQMQMGFREIKMYTQLSPVAYDTIVALAKRHGLTFAGHAPTSVSLRHVIESGQRSIEHPHRWRASTQLAEDAKLAAKHGTYACPTLEVQSVLAKGNGDDIRAGVVKVLYDNNVKLLVGTDSGIKATQAGTSIHDELGKLVGAGVSRFDALRGATTLAAEYLGQTQNIGSVAVGTEADLLLLNANPLTDIGATRQIEAVLLNGVRVR